jgi:uncharacterized SAM-binding protein YcdF (DUF218 family)
MLLFNQFITFFIAPLGTALLVWALAAALSLKGLKRTARVLAVVAFVWLWCWSTPLASHWLRGQLEALYPPLPLTQVPTAQALVVLGGTMEPPDAVRPWPNLGPGADRVWHASRLYAAGKAPVVLLSGGSDMTAALYAESLGMRQFMLDLGVPAAALLTEERSRNTRENAEMSARLLRERGIQKVLLVTSALHMRRAVKLFEQQGLVVHPVATDHEVGSPNGRMSWLPDANALDGSARAFKEMVGYWQQEIVARWFRRD